MTDDEGQISSDPGQGRDSDDQMDFREIMEVLESARKPDQPPVTQVESDEDAAEAASHDPMAGKQQALVSDGGLNIVHSMINRTVFFDLFRHVANKRYPDLKPEKRVDQLAREERTFYQVSKWGDFILRALSVLVTIGLAGAILIKAVFF